MVTVKFFSALAWATWGIAFAVGRYAEAFPPARSLMIPLPAAGISLDPTSVQDQSSLWVSRQVNCQLFRFRQGKVIPEAIATYRFLSPTRIEMKLNDRFQFHDGSAVRAQDVTATFAYLKKSRRVLRNIFEWVVEVRAPDANTVVFRLGRPVPHFLKVLSSPNYAIFKKEFLERVEKDAELWKKPVGCGVYRIEETTADRIRLVSGHPRAPRVTFTFRRGKRLTRSEVPAYDLISFDLAPADPDPHVFREEKLFDPYHIFVGLNTRLERWRHREDRCRFLSRLDASSIVKDYAGEGERAQDLIPRGALGYSPAVDYPSELQREFPPEVRPAPAGICVGMLGVSIGQERRETFLSMFRNAVGVDKTLVIEQPKHYAIQFEKSQCDALVLGLKSNYLDGYEYLLVFSEKDANFTGYWDPQTQVQIRNSQTISDPAKKAAAYQVILTKLREECLIYPLVTLPNRKVYVRRELKTPGLGENFLNDFLLETVR